MCRVNITRMLTSSSTEGLVMFLIVALGFGWPIFLFWAPQQRVPSERRPLQEPLTSSHDPNTPSSRPTSRRPRQPTPKDQDNTEESALRPEVSSSSSSSSFLVQDSPSPSPQRGNALSTLDGVLTPLENLGVTGAEQRFPIAEEPVSSSNWRCACQGGFLPPGLLQTLGGGMEATFRMGSGQCYHQQR